MYKQMLRNVRLSKEGPTVSVGSSGVLYLNAAAMRGVFKDVSYVTIFYDEVTRKLAIKPAKETANNKFKLGFSNNTASTGVIAARSVIKQIGLAYDKELLRYDGLWNSKVGMLEVDLKSPRQIKQRRSTGVR